MIVGKRDIHGGPERTMLADHVVCHEGRAGFGEISEPEFYRLPRPPDIRPCDGLGNARRNPGGTRQKNSLTVVEQISLQINVIGKQRCSQEGKFRLCRY